MKKVKAGITYP